MDSLPSYTTLATAGTTKRSFIENGITVHVVSQAASKTSPPTFHNESVVSGSVEVPIKDGLFSSTKSVTIEFVGFERKLFDLGSGQGRMNQTNLAEVPFMNMQQVLYDKMQQRLDQGVHKFDFQFAFPKTYTSNSRKALNEVIELPPTFQVPGYPTYLQYQLKCIVKYSGLSDDTIVKISLNYVPRREAPPPSPSRALAYETGTPLPDPNVDPDGWKTESADAELRVFGARDARLHCVLSLPVPLEYPRGYPLPFHVALTCTDSEVRDLLNTAEALSVALQRRTYISHWTKKSASDTREWMSSVAGKGIYWKPGPAAAAAPETLYFEGEIHLSNQLMQSFAFPKVSLDYAVELTLQVSGLATSSEGPIVSIPVGITYFPASNSPRPRSNAPMGVERSAPAPDDTMYFLMRYE